MMRHDSFAVFILTHGRPDNVRTLKSLYAGNYTGKIYLVIDNEDDTADEYKALYGDMVVMFDKLAVSKTFDTADNFSDRRTVVFARNACFGIAKDLGIKYFLELDDDYTTFMFRKITHGKMIGIECKQLDRLFDAMLDFLDDSGALTVALAQGGDFIGGALGNRFQQGILRKAMNTFFCKTDKPFKFLGRINEDVNTYTRHGQMGELLFTITSAQITQLTTQSNSGGMTNVYLDSGTYIKSFYTVLYSPSCVHVALMGANNRRMHHHVRWNNCTPKILSESLKKAS